MECVKLADWRDAVDRALDSSNSLRKALYRHFFSIRQLPRKGRREKKWADLLWSDEEVFRANVEATHRLRLESRTVQLGLWPAGYRAACVLNFDDLSPKSARNWPYDWGGEPRGGVNREFGRVLQDYPYIKVTHFVCANSQTEARLFRLEHPGDRFLITKAEHAAWRDWLHAQVATGMVEIAGHGLSHFNPKARVVAAEYENVPLDEIMRSLQSASAYYSQAGFSVRGLRPPAWGMGQGNSIAQALVNLGFLYGALSAVTEGLNRHSKLVSNIYPTWFRGLLNLPQNLILDHGPRFSCPQAYRVVEAGGLLAPKGHYSDSYSIAAGLYPENVYNLRALLDFLAKGFPEQIWYATYREVAEFWTAKAGIRVEPGPHGQVLLHNRSPYPAKRLSVRILETGDMHVVDLEPEASISLWGLNQ